MLAAGVKCSIGSDDPVLMQTSLTEDAAVAVRLGHTPRAMYEHAVAGAFCEDRRAPVFRPRATLSTGKRAVSECRRDCRRRRVSSALERAP